MKNKKKHPPISEILNRIFGKRQEISPQTSGSQNVRKPGSNRPINVNQEDPDAFSFKLGNKKKPKKMKNAFSKALGKGSRSRGSGKEQHFKN